jgi:hypothetical protein
MQNDPGPARTFSPDGKAYRFFGDYLREKYGHRVLKLPINAGLGCPNREDGREGCIFCSETGSASPTSNPDKLITDQMQEARESFVRSDQETSYIAYFQAFTNTRGPIPVLKRMYDRALVEPDVMGLMIATRPDCCDDEVLDLVASYIRPGRELWLEIGMQTMHDRSLRWMNRGHDHGQTRDAVRRAAERGIPVCVHVILAIPGEDWRDMMETAREISSLPVSGVKIHHLHVIRNTPLERIYEARPFYLPKSKEYVSLLVDFLERLRPDIVIHRLMGDHPEEGLVVPGWGLHKGTILRDVDLAFSSRGTCQGFLVEQLNAP